MHRRRFLTGSGAAVLATGSATVLAHSSVLQVSTGGTRRASATAAANVPRVQDAGEMRGEMLYRKLGATGVDVSVIGLGGSHLGQATVTEEMAIRLIHEGIDRGINFLDNSWDYNERRSEMLVGKALSQDTGKRHSS